ncbi:helix-turn-helix domain-containing protein [Streptomyces calvus]|uniref:helix-turn-helix domain-containing protein n=1 Tax=Streptomyces calvus TaxID=67282 RepID=UPI00389A84C0
MTPESLRKQYESGATVDELVAANGLSYGTVLNRLHEAGTEMRTSWQTRRMRQDPQARQRLAAHLRALYEQHGATLTELAAAGAGTSCPAPADRGRRHRAHPAADAADARRSAGRRAAEARAVGELAPSPRGPRRTSAPAPGSPAPRWRSGAVTR